MQTYIKPGQPWLDTKGERIQAHGGALFFEDGVYYWYGENKERTDGKSAVWTYGIRAYSSRDLYNWEDEGLIIPPVLDDPQSNLAPEKRVDRPHIIKNDKTGQYVCWIKLSGPEACFLLLTADRFLGPYTIVRENFRPFDSKVGDFDLLKREDGSVYLYFDANHAGITCTRLTDDYLDVTGPVTRQYEGLHPPFNREGVTLFERGGTIYLVTSGQTGYIPNQSDCAAADDPLGPFIPIGDPHVDDDSRASFNSQISQVFHVPGRDLYLALADRWVPEYVVDARRADLFTRAIGAHFDPEKYHVEPAEAMELRSSPMLESANTSISDYVWLPMEWEGSMPRIRWRDAWNLEELQ